MIAAFLVLVAGFWLLSALVQGIRLRALPRLTASEPGRDDDFVLLAGPGVSLDADAKKAVFANARARGLDLVDLVPARAPMWRLGLFAGAADVARAPTAFTLLTSAGYALVVSRALLARSARVWRAPRSPAEVAAIAARLSPYAGGRVGWVVAADLRVPSGDSPTAKLELANRHLMDTAGAMLMVNLFLYLAVPVATVFAPWPGALALLTLHLAPLVVFAGAPVRPRSGELVAQVLFRLPLDLLESAQVLLGWRAGEDPEVVSERRAAYPPVDPESLLEPRRDDCPMCGGRDLGVWVETPDIVQHKPGDFVLERCAGCGHVFQNPRVSLEGLAFYYRDFYDGMGADGTEKVFASQVGVLSRRAHAVDGLARPRRWLDVGGGHGHFAQMVREIHPGVAVDGLDMSESIDDAARRGWIDRAYRGLFPDAAARLAGEGYDVLSMNHYLEHTLDPAAEIAAAHRVLTDGGLLLIEVPNPESQVGRFIGPHWGQWVQPQHLHFFSAGNLDKLLRARGFEPLRWHFGEAHIGLDLLTAAWVFVGRLAPPPHLPWKPPPGPMDFVRRDLVIAVSLPFLAVAGIGDLLLKPFTRSRRFSNAFRVVARKRAA